jgi:hypothetical protein
MVGLPDPEVVYQQVATALHRFRGGMAPNQADEEPLRAGGGGELSAILAELRAIRRAVERP